MRSYIHFERRLKMESLRDPVVQARMHKDIPYSSWWMETQNNIRESMLDGKLMELGHDLQIDNETLAKRRHSSRGESGLSPGRAEQRQRATVARSKGD
jgi:hypothetical protein